MGVRIYWNGSSNRKPAFFEAEMDLREEYAYRKIDGGWEPAQKILKKTGGGWLEHTDYRSLEHENMIQR